MAEARLVANGMTPFEVTELDRKFGRNVVEWGDHVGIYLLSGDDTIPNNGLKMPIIKLKQETYHQ